MWEVERPQPSLPESVLLDPLQLDDRLRPVRLDRQREYERVSHQFECTRVLTHRVTGRLDKLYRVRNWLLINRVAPRPVGRVKPMAIRGKPVPRAVVTKRNRGIRTFRFAL